MAPAESAQECLAGSQLRGGGGGLYVFVSQWNRWEGEARCQTTDDAYLQADLTPLSAQIPGYVQAVPVQDYAA